jgi:membrane protein DedA with SNARE-associated domain
VSHFITEHGLPLLFLVVLVESFGVPVPGETALIAFGVLASQGHYGIWEVIAVAAVAAIIGDNLGYWVIGRWGGRRLLGRWGWLRRYSDRVLPRAERVMARHGGKTVFIGRFVSVLRYTVAWIAGITHMGAWRFLAWNAAGGIAWATAVGLVSYYGGKALAETIARDGLYVAGGLIVAVALIWLGLRIARRRLEARL